ncbi:hypothetical protein A2419_03455 [Candidatus Adlerbacteria bacterium RIFOXYC1_FULL_48_26]|uniref:Thioredoxin domain-containing protein n=1 Tax=Candidatus Adlerbacteria bacterium RIFOXYC1_FULL_48_26 TaxID=1797247 RepID=A0A1F4Y4E7_9BACT|nr:MAG: hypothetical protein A2419_03455 [Candidatus Adlerbacteria bacterium RIFOXYC1_FULL_48_26]OGC94361.1 MAG: hypothetical protein A2389_01250 [Candidatus Adlerbacteria bacterium RIFOXYB1_FULL_48_10]OGC96383.1 MAG: hypothetical protein A2590_02140 [Candidatus Adlerbacteria bacterium RIFOXYD1_FULL_48_8]
MSEEKGFKLSAPVAILLAGIIIAAAVVFTSKPAAPAEGAGLTPPTVSVKDIRPPTAGDHIMGSPSAPIVLIEYSDFQCPFCEVIYPTLKKIVDESNGQISLVYRQFPLTTLHPQALPAAHASECIAAQLGNDGFWKYADTVFKNQAQLSTSYSAQLAQQLGADMTKYNQCIANSTYQKNIDADSQEVQAIGGSGTPYVVVLNTKTGKAAVIPGALPYAQAMQVIKSVQ